MASLGLVAALGFLLIVSLAASTALAALNTYLGGQNAVRPIAARGAQYARLSEPIHTALCRNLQGPAGHTYRLARGRPRCFHHRLAIYDRQIPHWPVSGHNSRQFGLWRSRRAGPHSTVGVLLRADPIWCRAYPGCRGAAGRAEHHHLILIDLARSQDSERDATKGMAAVLS